MRELRTEVSIDAPAPVVWEILADFGSYEEWNPYVVEGRGRAVPGEGLRLRFGVPNEGEKTYEPTVGTPNPAGG